ncbi:MAG: hypothetical protein R3E31_04410 [Chloroflexota bacterium]
MGCLLPPQSADDDFVFLAISGDLCNGHLFVWVSVNLLALIGSLALSAAALGIPSHRSLWVLPLVLLSQPVLHHLRVDSFIFLYSPWGLSLWHWGLPVSMRAWAGFALQD